ncbi:3-phenylpropionate/cinnamic acid dioxygenase subunit beta [Phenylobacterium aquaticum]|uniref:3-phenylpropionate/cinnamic acid dioxygenase subunit beta n=1 Tax=Phenylobacterium aquaticum TaxID=1763816 RepID=UPI001F5C5B40|nr:3-phenylpropionate/cinnamic acid dioxygenase subunit beta [Phenylobacterium aquaticum]MCI3133346.1 3-phenylpropionate/cinnamic acid dioxygenase subunit beta [Phenylobacterium aquaticum]
MSVNTLESPAAGARQASLQLFHDVQQLLYKDARLLDEQRYDDWFELMTEDFRFWVPVPQSRYRRDSKGIYEHGRMAHFDDSLTELKLRASRWKEATAWSEDPPTRHVHYVTNIEVEPTETAGEWLVRSVVISLRNRNEDEENWLGARREDLVRETSAGLKLAGRKVFVTQSVLMAKNFNTFL